MTEDQGASLRDRAASLRPQPPAASSQSSIPSAARWLPQAKSPIWDYARRMKLSMQKMMPPDGSISFCDGGLIVRGTIRTMQEAEAMREIIRHLGQTLPSSRQMIAGDIGVDPPAEDWRERLYKMLAVPAQAIEATPSQD